MLVERFQSQLKLNPLQLDDPDTRISLQVAKPFLTELVEELGMQDIGLVAAQEIGSEHLGLAEYVARSRDSLGSALIGSVQFARLLCDGIRPSVEVQGALVFVRFSFDATCSLSEAVYDFTLATQLKSIRRITRMPELAPLEVHFTYPEPAHVTSHEQLFNCKLRFSMPFSQLVLPASALALALPGSEPGLCSFLERQAHLSLAGLPKSLRIVPRVRDMLAAELTLGSTNSKRVAQCLGMSCRTLARRLASENTNFQLLFDQTRRDLALHELTYTARTISDIAKWLGFSSTQSFHRAFRRWTGSTATTYRRSSSDSLRAEEPTRRDGAA